MRFNLAFFQLPLTDIEIINFKRTMDFIQSMICFDMLTHLDEVIKRHYWLAWIWDYRFSGYFRFWFWFYSIFSGIINTLIICRYFVFAIIGTRSSVCIIGFGYSLCLIILHPSNGARVGVLLWWSIVLWGRCFTISFRLGFIHWFWFSDYKCPNFTLSYHRVI